MTGRDLFIGMGYIDEELIDEALRYQKTSMRAAVKWGLIAACAAAAVFAGVLAVQRLGTPARPSDDAPTQMDERFETPAPETPAPGFAFAEPEPSELPEAPAPPETPEPAAPSGELVVPPAASPPTASTPAADAPAPPDRPPQPTAPPQATAPAPQPTLASEPTPRPWPETGYLEPTGPNPPGVTVPPELSFSGRVTQPDPDDAVYVVSILAAADSEEADFDSDYTDVLCETEGVELLSQERTETGEELTVRILPASSPLRLSFVTLRVMDGEKEKISFTYYGLNTEEGVWFQTPPGSIWQAYYSKLVNAGKITPEQYQRVIDALRYLLTEPVLEDPMLSLGTPIPLTITHQPMDLTCYPGEIAWFWISATGSLLTYQWQCYDPETKTWTDAAYGNPGSSSLTFIAEEFHNGLYYRCVVTDENGDSITSAYARMTVPTATEPPPEGPPEEPREEPPDEPPTDEPPVEPPPSDDPGSPDPVDP